MLANDQAAARLQDQRLCAGRAAGAADGDGATRAPCSSAPVRQGIVYAIVDRAARARSRRSSPACACRPASPSATARSTSSTSTSSTLRQSEANLARRRRAEGRLRRHAALRAARLEIPGPGGKDGWLYVPFGPPCNDLPAADQRVADTAASIRQERHGRDRGARRPQQRRRRGRSAHRRSTGSPRTRATG